MKKILSGILLLAMLLSLFTACGKETVAPSAETSAPTAQTTETTEAAETSGTTEATDEATDATEETEASLADYPLYLKVSAITFSLVGESEDIYLGLAPRELVTWESDDPAVVSVENGVLTAVSVGTTTVRATYTGQEIAVTAGCLAQTQEELDALGFDILCQPKRIAPEVDLSVPCTYFDDAALVGDSIAYMMVRVENEGDYLGDMTFLARGGVSMNGFVRRFMNLFYQGDEVYMEDAIALSQVKRAYIHVGSNDIGDAAQRKVYMENWAIMLERIREKSPDVEIVILSNIPQYAFGIEATGTLFLQYNKNVVKYNKLLQDFAAENGCMYLDICYYMQDHCNRMPRVYNLDGFHPNDDGYMVLMQILRYYARFETDGGTLS